MKLIQGITDQPKQNTFLPLADGSKAAWSLTYKPQQSGWFYDITWGSVAIIGQRLVSSPNILRQYRNLIPFGISVIGSGNTDPLAIGDLSDGTIQLVLLEGQDLNTVETAAWGALPSVIQAVGVTQDGTPVIIPPDEWGPAGGDLSRLFPNPWVVAIHEAGGPTQLLIGAIADGQFLVRSGQVVEGADGIPSTPSGPAGGPDMTGTYPDPILTNVVTAGKYGRVSVNAKGRVIVGYNDVTNVLNFAGVDPTGATASDAGFALAGAALPAANGCLYVPPGKYVFKDGFSIIGKLNLVILGVGAEFFADCPAIALSSLTHVTTTATATTATGHGYTTGQNISVRGAAQGQYNGSFTITVTSATTFTYVMGSDPGVNATGTIKAQKNVQTLVVDQTSVLVRTMGIRFNSNATIRGDGVHYRMNASESSVEDCAFEKSSGFGLFLGEGVTVYQTNCTVDSCQFVGTIGDGLHMGGVDGVAVNDCVFDNTGDDSIGVIGYEAYADVCKNVHISGCVIRNMQNAGGGSGAGIRLNMCLNCSVDGVVFNNIAGPAVRLSDSGGGHTSVYNEDCSVSDLEIRACSLGVEAYFTKNFSLSDVRAFDCTGFTFADWLGDMTVSNVKTYGNGANSICLYTPPLTSFAGRNFASTWGNLIISGCSVGSSISDPSNFLMYQDTNGGFTYGNLIIQACIGMIAGSGDWIVYKGIGGTGKVTNNTVIGKTATAVSNGGGNAATLTNNN